MKTRQVTGGTDTRRTFETVYYRISGSGTAAWEGMARADRAAALSRSSDINDMATRIDRGLRDHGIHGVT